MSKPRNRGFIALMSAIIIATILLLVATTGGLTGIFARGDALDLELKARSVAAADACADQALLALAQDPSYAGGGPNPSFVLNSIDKCYIGTVAPATCKGVAGAYKFHVQGISSNAAITNLEICADPTDLSVISWQEIPQF